MNWTQSTFPNEHIHYIQLDGWAIPLTRIQYISSSNHWYVITLGAKDEICNATFEEIDKAKQFAESKLLEIVTELNEYVIKEFALKVGPKKRVAGGTIAKVEPPISEATKINATKQLCRLADLMETCEKGSREYKAYAKDYRAYMKLINPSKK